MHRESRNNKHATFKRSLQSSLPFESHVQLRLEMKSTIWPGSGSSLFHFQLPGKYLCSQVAACWMTLWFLCNNSCWASYCWDSHRNTQYDKLPKGDLYFCRDWKTSLCYFFYFLGGNFSYFSYYYWLYQTLFLSYQFSEPTTPQQIDALSGLIMSGCKVENINFV